MNRQEKLEYLRNLRAGKERIYKGEYVVFVVEGNEIKLDKEVITPQQMERIRLDYRNYIIVDIIKDRSELNGVDVETRLNVILDLSGFTDDELRDWIERCSTLARAS